VADAVRAAARGEAVVWPFVLPIRPHGDKTPLFCLTGANGSGFYLRDLAAELPADQPFYALQIPGIEPGGAAIDSVPELSAFLLPHIRAIQPHGPYLLAGHSFGGLIAFEMARQLEQLGETVERVVIFDTTLASPGDHTNAQATVDAAYLQNVLEVLGWSSHLAESLPLDATGKLVATPEVTEFLLRLLPQIGMMPHNATREQKARIVAVWRTAARAHANYAPPTPINAPIILFLARTAPKHVVRAEERLDGWGWQNWTRSGLQVEVVSGNHVNLLVPPFVRESGSRLKEILSHPKL